MTSHTPTPWHCNNKVGYVFGPDCVVATCGDFKDQELVPFNADRWNADAALIVRAVNSFDAMKKALEQIVEAQHAGDEVMVIEVARAALRLADEGNTKT